MSSQIEEILYIFFFFLILLPVETWDAQDFRVSRARDSRAATWNKVKKLLFQRYHTAGRSTKKKRTHVAIFRNGEITRYLNLNYPPTYHNWFETLQIIWSDVNRENLKDKSFSSF